MFLAFNFITHINIKKAFIAVAGKKKQTKMLTYAYFYA
ncbi:hypothetical protein AC84_6281 [Escherichia coli 1-392-07_S4_C1]|uniref:Uncharacterized protein n=1 Tax=Escherichia coli 2-460-02_S1_C1 TaxID=1444044 RepID=A0A836N5N2_ECOLX|nr:hypothetical protein AD31_5587 [Escherichia coli 2-427-07_S4_C3]KEJ61666.1 hypothetical protein AC88_2395 [Escherichia coli 3-267-03_S4_C1]KEN81273.1 hypothetical protein AD40_5711 [Escherichia coli 1-392-07_S4_C3]KEN81610.1 hypothetical protein AC84_6281 [Escherichia coli 1-392-07_S4_C1]KEO20271.1 hypothetical protein AB05_5768 [Escherichia coli 2-460-02_S1_C1]